MLKGLWSLTALEIKIFAREPLGLIGTVLIPVGLVVWLGRMFGPGTKMAAGPPGRLSDAATVPVLVSLLIALNAVLSLVTIIAIYRESGILKRLRATPLRSHTILPERSRSMMIAPAPPSTAWSHVAGPSPDSRSVPMAHPWRARTTMAPCRFVIPPLANRWR